MPEITEERVEEILEEFEKDFCSDRKVIALDRIIGDCIHKRYKVIDTTEFAAATMYVHGRLKA